ncbi:MAG: ABC transporter substrate-binding protein [Deltaproteobacteria bacterium]|nr:ABC transporter substrate-binding protein [Deltaproteobacteria bacterium]
MALDTQSLLNKTDTPQYKKIISLKPNITMILKDLGLNKEIVGVTKFCKTPNPEAQIVGDYNSVDLEGVLRLKPDLVLISTENTQSRQFDALKSARLNIKVFDFKTFDQFIVSLKEIAALLGLQARGTAVIKQIEAQLAALREKLVIPKQPPKSFIVLVQRHPLMVATGNTYISTLFKKAGLLNVFEFNRIPYPVMDEEEIIREIVDYTFDISHRTEAEVETHFLNKTIIPLNTEDFIATPQSVDNLVRLMHSLNANNPKSGLTNN